MKIRLAGTVNDSVVDGEGYRFTVFVQGCPHHCGGCHNPATWDFSGGYEADTDDILAEIKKNSLLEGVTLSGGEPFESAGPLIDIAKKARSLGLDIWVYTGYALETLVERHDPETDELLSLTDVLVDGPFVMAERDLTLKFRGSRNQRVIDMNATRERGEVILKYE